MQRLCKLFHIHFILAIIAFAVGKISFVRLYMAVTDDAVLPIYSL